MKDSPHYPGARLGIYMLLRAAGVPDAIAGGIADEVLTHAARAASDYLGSVPVADRVVVTDHRSTRLAAESPDMHRAQVAALGKGG